MVELDPGRASNLISRYGAAAVGPSGEYVAGPRQPGAAAPAPPPVQPKRKQVHT